MGLGIERREMGEWWTFKGEDYICTHEHIDKMGKLDKPWSPGTSRL